MLNHIESLSQSHPVRRIQAQNTRDKLVQEGIAQVLQHGWAATGIDTVLRQCSVPKGSFYHYFDSKEAFGYALLEAYQASRMQRLQHWLVLQPTGSLEQLCTALEGLLAETTAQLEQDHFQRGCLVGALGQEMASTHEGFRLRLLDCLAQWEGVLTGAISNCLSGYEKQSKPVVKNTKTVGLIDLQALSQAHARAFWVNWQGALLHSQLARNAQALQVVQQQLQQQVMDIVLQLRRQQPDAKPVASTQLTAQLPKAKQQSDKTVDAVKSVNKIKTTKTVKKSSKIKALQVSLDF
jgi:TetR/AcrR family transcriptional regulator, transcriptional repressor for nem operon